MGSSFHEVELSAERVAHISREPNLRVAGGPHLWPSNLRVPHFSRSLREVGTANPCGESPHRATIHHAARIFIFRTDQSFTRTNPDSP